MQTRGGEESFRCTPTQEEMGLRFDFKPQVGAWSNFLKWQLTFLGREALEENYSKNIWFRDQAGDKLRQWCPREFNSRSKNWKGPLGEMGVANTAGRHHTREGITPDAGAPGGLRTGRYQCLQTAAKQWGTIN